MVSKHECAAKHSVQQRARSRQRLAINRLEPLSLDSVNIGGYVLRQSACRTLITTRRSGPADLLATVATLAPRLWEQPPAASAPPAAADLPRLDEG